MWCHLDLVWTDVSEERMASIFRVEKSASEEPAWAGGCHLLFTYKAVTVIWRGRWGHAAVGLWFVPLLRRSGRIRYASSVFEFNTSFPFTENAAKKSKRFTRIMEYYFFLGNVSNIWEQIPHIYRTSFPSMSQEWPDIIHWIFPTLAKLLSEMCIVQHWDSSSTATAISTVNVFVLGGLWTLI
jgi:hypothetical protein